MSEPKDESGQEWLNRLAVSVSAATLSFLAAFQYREQQTQQQKTNYLQNAHDKLLTEGHYRPFKALVVGSSPTQPTIFTNGVGLHSARLDWPALHWLDGRFREAAFRASERRTHTTQRLGDQLEAVAILELNTIEQARIIERKLKAKKNPKLTIPMLQGLH